MAKKAPGKHCRKGISLLELYEMFPNDKTAEQWFVSERWPDGLRCAYCDGERVGAKGNHPSMPYHCADCRKFFSVKTGTVMQSSKIGYRKWAMALYLMTTNCQGHVQHEAAPRYQGDAKDRLAHGAQNPPRVGQRH